MAIMPVSPAALEAFEQLSTTTIIASLISASVVYSLGLIIYRLYFHPLAKYPGPLFARISSIYGVYHAFLGDRHLNQYRQHEKYGEFVRLAPNLISVSHPDSLRDIYRADKSIIKSWKFYGTSHIKEKSGKEATSIIGLINKVDHAARRRMMGHAFSESALREFEPNVHKTIDAFIAELGSRPKWTGNMANYFTYLTYDVMGQLAFGKDMGMLEGKDRDVPVALDGLMYAGLIRSSWNLMVYLLPLIDWNITRKAKKFENHAKNQMLLRKKLGSNRKDVMSYMIDALENNKGGLSLLALEADARILIIAGTDTTSVQLAANMYYITRNPKVLERLTAEIRSTFDSMEEIKIGTKLADCTYLKAVVDETLRMSPSVPAGVYREADKGGATVAGHFMPEGTELVAPLYTIQHNPKYFPEPFKFQPQRWLPEESGADAVAQARSAFAPFTLGSRGCLGKRLAYVEIYLVLAKILYLYDPKYVSGGTEHAHEGQDIDEFHLTDHFTAHVDGPVIEFSKRKEEGEEEDQ